MPHRPMPRVAIALLLALPAIAGATEMATNAEAKPAAKPSAATSSADKSSAPAPHLVVLEPEFDFGTLVTGDVVNHDFVLRNEGNAPLEIEKVQPSCGCTLVDFDHTIPAGGTGKIAVKVDSLRLNGKGGSQLLVTSNDPVNPATEVKLQYEVKPSIAADPGYARWIYVQGEPQGTISETFWALDNADFKILSLDVPSELKATFREAKPEERKADFKGSQWKVDVVLPPDSPVGAITGVIVLHTDHPKQKRVALPVSGFVRPRQFLSPTSGDFGELHLTEPKKAVYLLQNFATDPLVVNKVETTVKGITASVKPLQAGRKFEITLEMDPQAMGPGPFDGKLRVQISDPKNPVIELPLHGQLVAGPAVASHPGA